MEEVYCRHALHARIQTAKLLSQDPDFVAIEK